MTIATIERLGGVIMTRFYDPLSLIALQDPETYFKTGKPIPKCKLPPTDAVEYYSDPKFRGYLADPEKIAEERVALSQKYGYDLPDLSESDKLSLLLKRKDPRQIFLGLHPGWIVNLTEKKILKPKAEYLQEYYHSWDLIWINFWKFKKRPIWLLFKGLMSKVKYMYTQNYMY